ncbi:hypothetical protein Cgig2_019880 [Carnegiea gigantea]|uniref:Expansin-like B1 n=1 Tax=Carnegiea gigantea TaxID=171969 RepID=A0A9Q1KJC8_9CARY|nr:hypothetical protein Cgig2_019880 [Carnegiea gigantea]
MVALIAQEIQVCGACGYGELGNTLNNGYVAGVHRPYKNGTGCGGCYQVRCKGGCCTDEGVVVVATDFGVGDWVDFLFPAQVYAKMARPGFDAELLSYGVVDVEFRRVLCTYGGSPSSLVFKIHGGSKFPHYLAFIILHAPGLYDVVGVQIWQEDCREWRPMRKPFGAVWDMENPPSGPLNLRFQLSATIYDAKWVELPNIIGAYLQSGNTYSTVI